MQSSETVKGESKARWKVAIVATKHSWPHAAAPPCKRGTYRPLGKWLILPRLKINRLEMSILNFSPKPNEGAQIFKYKPRAEWHHWQELPCRHLPSGGSIIQSLCESHSVPPRKDTINSAHKSNPTYNFIYASNKSQTGLLCLCKELYFMGLNIPFFLLNNRTALQERLSTCASHSS